MINELWQQTSQAQPRVLHWTVCRLININLCQCEHAAHVRDSATVCVLNTNHCHHVEALTAAECIQLMGEKKNKDELLRDLAIWSLNSLKLNVEIPMSVPVYKMYKLILPVWDGLQNDCNISITLIYCWNLMPSHIFLLNVGAFCHEVTYKYCNVNICINCFLLTNQSD